jgi:hypothetical protein
MAQQDAPHRDEKDVEIVRFSLGAASRPDPNRPMVNTPLSREALSARQASVSIERKYYGPVFEEMDETATTDYPPTDVAEG